MFIGRRCFSEKKVFYNFKLMLYLISYFVVFAAFRVHVSNKIDKKMLKHNITVIINSKCMFGVYFPSGLNFTSTKNEKKL